ncbi:MAG: hypothetical protein JWP97_1011 [Labilithrix sp.]|nr:hypothetical protein [Labilithrix sp.]
MNVSRARAAAGRLLPCSLLAVLSIATTACGTPAPASRVPDARAALSRVHASQDCGLGIHANAKIDHFGKAGRVRGDLLFFALWPARLRMDVIGPMNVGVVATLTADAQRFAFADMREKRFLFGPASACNIARLTTVSMPGHVLVSLLRGDAPVLVHDDAKATVEWSSHGYYVVRIPSTRDAEEELHLAPHPSDLAKPWQEQRLRVVDVLVRQQGLVVYHAELADHRPASTAKTQVDADGIDAPIPPSGPVCQAELPRSIHVEVPGKQADVLFRYEDVSWNPPLTEGLFEQPAPAGLRAERVVCDE